MMKNFGAILMILVGLQLANAQVMSVNGVDSFFNLDKDVSNESDRTLATYNNKFYAKGFTPAKVDNFKTVLSLRYNIFNNEMEYSKDGGVFNLRKSAGTIINFQNLNATFECLEYNGKLAFFQTYEANDSNNLRLITRQSVRYTAAERATGGYKADKPAKYTRRKDEHFFLLDGEFTKVPRSKKAFFAFFDSDAQNVKDFVKKEGLGRKSLEDLQKVVSYYNSLNEIK